MDFTFPAGQPSIILYFAVYFVAIFAAIFIFIFIPVVILSSFRKEDVREMRKGFPLFVLFVSVLAVLGTMISAIAYPDVAASKEIGVARADITSGIERVYDVNVSESQYGIAFGKNQSEFLKTVRNGGVVETDSFSDGDNIYKFRVTDSTIILLEKSLTSGGDGFAEAEHVK